MKSTFFKNLILFIVFIFLIITLSSCNKEENPVIPPTPPPPGPDTVSRYVWTLIHLGSYMYDVYAADSNKIFIVGNAQLLLYNGSYISSYELNDLRFGVKTVYGFDKNNIFVAGEYVINFSKPLPIIKKITNGVITSYTIGDTGSVLKDMLVTGPNQAWFSEVQKNKLYYFNNGIVTTYILNENDSIRGGKFYLNTNNELFVFASDTYNTLIGGTSFTYKFINGNFILQRTDCYGHFPCNDAFVFRCGKDVIMAEGDINRCRTKYFNGTEWVDHSFLDSVGAPFSKIGGISKDSLVGFNISNKIYTYGKTNKWRIENNSPLLKGDLYGRRTNIEMKFGSIYFTYIDTYTGGFTSFIIGRPNKNFKN